MNIDTTRSHKALKDARQNFLKTAKQTHARLTKERNRLNAQLKRTNARIKRTQLQIKNKAIRLAKASKSTAGKTRDRKSVV